MKQPKLRIKTRNFRAVKSADLIVDGITVVAGENGCGKSSISKLIYYLYKTVSSFEEIVNKGVSGELRNIFHSLEIVERELIFSYDGRKERSEVIRGISKFKAPLQEDEVSHLGRSIQMWLNYINHLSVLFNERVQVFGLEKFKRSTLILLDIVRDEKEVVAGKEFEYLKSKIDGVFKKGLGLIESRPISIFRRELRSIFTDGVLPEVFDVYEFGEEIISLSKDTIAIPYNIQKAFYIDTPMMLSVEVSANDYWDDLHEALFIRPTKSNNLSTLISQEVIHGDVDLEPDVLFSDSLTYKRVDGKSFDLLDVATGIKSFSILQILIKNGSIDDKTLLIIDEPESHLHPQWIIEYARLIVTLNKKIGVKFFIASHNPDFVSAIRYIGEKEGVLDDVNFYLAKESEKKFEYDFEHLGTNIDPIFESFNIAIERINQYGQD